MSVLFSGIFWGIFLLLLGLSVILKAAFHIDIPVFRTFFGLLLVFLGLRVLLGGHWPGKGEPAAPFGDTRISAPKPDAKYDVVFGKGVLDLGSFEWKGEEARLESNTIFGHTRLVLSERVPTRVVVSAAFSGANFPDGNLISFGDYTYTSKAWRADKPCLTLKASVVFGGLDVVE